MEWSAIDRTGTERAWGENWTYVVIRTETGVRLSRFGADRAILLTSAAEVMRNLIVFPLGRGPGRPGGDLELAALLASAKGWADRYEAALSAPSPLDRIDWRTGQVVREAPPEGWELVCPGCGLSGGQHAEDCRGIAIPRLADPNAGRCRGPEGCFPAEIAACPAFLMGECPGGS